MRKLARQERRLPSLHQFLFLSLLFAYNVNLRQVSSYDTYASRFVAISVLRDGALVLDEFFPWVAVAQAPDGHVSDFLVRSDRTSHYNSCQKQGNQAL